MMIHLKMFRSSAETNIPKRLLGILGSFSVEKTPLPNSVWLIRTPVILFIDAFPLSKDFLGGDAGCLDI